MVCLGLALAAACHLWVGRLYAVTSASMTPTLSPGERILVSRIGTDDLRRGDVVVADVSRTWGASGEGPSLVVKRVIGLPGERVSCCDADGRVEVDGEPIEEPYLPAAGVDDDVAAQAFEAVVPAGRVWLMGDHRDASSDSRHHLGSPGGGSVAIDTIEGTVVAVLWPLSSAGTLEASHRPGAVSTTPATVWHDGAV